MQGVHATAACNRCMHPLHVTHERKYAPVAPMAQCGPGPVHVRSYVELHLSDVREGVGNQQAKMQMRIGPAVPN